MGIGPFSRSSYSTYDRPFRGYDCVPPPPRPPNPDPKRYTILKSQHTEGYLILMVRYDGCTTFEGKKILVYAGVTIADLQKQASLDPHFSENPNFHSPIARFLPTDEGWRMAILFVTAMDLRERAYQTRK